MNITLLTSLSINYLLSYLSENQSILTGALNKSGITIPITQSRYIASRMTEKKRVIPERKEVGLPVRIKIPKIQVDAAFEYVGLTPHGAIDVPKNPDRVAWFDTSPRPGEKGNAIVVGHYGTWRSGATSVFDKLHLLRKGDRVEVSDKAGKIVYFTVREVRRYDAGASTEDLFVSSSSGAHLNLITCDGIWNEASQIYSKRLVIFAEQSLSE